MTSRSIAPRQSLRSRAGALLALSAALLVLIGVVALLAVRDQDRDLDEVRNQLVPARVEAAMLESSLLDRQSALRGFVITQNTEQLGEFNEAGALASKAEEEVRRHLDGSPLLLDRLDAVVRASDEWTADIAQPAIASVEAGDPGTAGVLIDTFGAALFDDEVRASIAELRSGVDEELAARDAALSDANRRLAAVLVIAIGLVAIALGLGALVVRRWVLLPITELDEAVNSRELDATISEDGPLEIARLGRNIDAMRRRIIDESRRAVRAREALGHQAAAVKAVQSALEPEVVDFPPGLDIAGRVRPAEGVLAGDWFEFVDLSRGGMAFAVADVSGHGVVPGVVALRAKQLVSAGLRMGMEPGEFLGWLDDELGDMGELFLTAFVGIIDVPSRSCRYANAGHPPAVVLSSEGPRRLEATGPLVGSVAGTRRTESVELPDPSLLIVATDGAIDARNATGEIFGEERLLACLRFESTKPTATLADYCLDEVAQFVGGTLVDDATIVVARLDGQQTELS